MKNRKTVLIAFLLVAALVMSVGYAYLSDTLTVSGTGQLSQTNAEQEFDLDVYFDKIVSRTNCTAVIDATDTTKDTVKITIDDSASAMATAGDYATVVIDVANQSFDTLNVEVVATNVPDGFFTISCDPAEFTIEPGTESDGVLTPTLKTITVTVTLNKSIPENMALEAFSLALNAESTTN